MRLYLEPCFNLVLTLPDPGAQSRAEKIQQLRADHQRRHQERQGHYPHDDREEEYEKQIQEDERKVGEATLALQFVLQAELSFRYKVVI